jgi:hypothetical protein
MAYDIKGTIYRLFPTKQVSDRFSKRSLVLSVMDGKYEQLVELEATGDKCSEGEEVRVTFNVRGREWTKPGNDPRYFVSLNVWKVESLVEKSSNPGPDDSMYSSGPSDSSPADPDDIPF